LVDSPSGCGQRAIQATLGEGCGAELPGHRRTGTARRPGISLLIVTARETSGETSGAPWGTSACGLVQASAAEEAEDGQHDDDEKNYQ
jgi:hypothetical protein